MILKKHLQGGNSFNFSERIYLKFFELSDTVSQLFDRKNAPTPASWAELLPNRLKGR